MPAIHLRVFGRVQGVGFRWFVMEKALELGIDGWVKNTPSGEVEVAASGESSKLAILESAVARGPVGARVTTIQRLPTSAGISLPSPFRIER